MSGGMDYHSLGGSDRSLTGADMIPNVHEAMTLTAKPHAFAGAVLSPKHAQDLTTALCLDVTSGLAEQSFRKAAVPYTLWIAEAWRILGWAEPSAALFWEMATMYHTLYLAGRAYDADFHDPTHIPPILSCGSTSSMGSSNTHPSDRPMAFDKKKQSTTASAKELPVWLIGTFLLLHCEELAFERNMAGMDERRFYGSDLVSADSMIQSGGTVDVTSLLRNPSLSPRTRLHAGWNNDDSHCTAYLLRHLRKVLLLSAVSHNIDAVRATIHLAAIPPPEPSSSTQHFRRKRYVQHSAEEIQREHDEEHGNIGLNIKLTMDDLERLHFTMRPPSGGGIDDPPLQIGEFLWNNLYATAPPPTATIPLRDVERELRRHLELELMMVKNQHGKQDVVHTDEDAASAAMSQLSLNDNRTDGGERARQPIQGYHKELSYFQLRSTTILLKPNSHESSAGASTGSEDAPHFVNSLASPGRLHDLAVSNCSDVHMYLLQPFESVTIAGCTGCTIVVGAVAGLLHVVDCEKTTITCAARRILVSNCGDAILFVFTPTSPLLVGDNRNCQFAPYNSYYDGLREDLVAAGLAAAVVNEGQFPYHHNSKHPELEAAWPPLQCASNKWNQPKEMAKLEIPAVPAGSSSASGSSSTSSSGSASPGADDKAVSGGKPGSGGDASLHAPVLLPTSDFHVLFVPLEASPFRRRRPDHDHGHHEPADEHKKHPANGDSQYCRLLEEVLQLSPFGIPVEYERHALVRADRMKSIQQAVQRTLTAEQRQQFEEELNRGFRDWLVTSGNLRQVLDLVHLEKRTDGTA
mmetsp:Transcript_6425/g.18952  ORF Transcript_6425/g.18952 Transcript_6425/m.18952 type:complete len:805 (+) Transcript_6425:122-2536(+)|eukprot:CAMPEP_0119564138 /NCGR_PEP_ID=MMETSP1352-20130426/25941_1 /TAXON_ID=265584 /ORGANISM="Stauroneis constricta, Strain CCMP1120" /LENGTH=804 /DNA_ID=CAMNT_0007612855 /DNA_START=45 /DNA_END=2459 /DNA_ORIENTATION=-